MHTHTTRTPPNILRRNGHGRVGDRMYIHIQYIEFDGKFKTHFKYLKSGISLTIPGPIYIRMIIWTVKIGYRNRCLIH